MVGILRDLGVWFNNGVKDIEGFRRLNVISRKGVGAGG